MADVEAPGELKNEAPLPLDGRSSERERAKKTRNILRPVSSGTLNAEFYRGIPAIFEVVSTLFQSTRCSIVAVAQAPGGAGEVIMLVFIDVVAARLSSLGRLPPSTNSREFRIERN